MLIHSVIDPMEIMPAPPRNAQWQAVDGGFLETVSGENGVTVSRLFSTDPALYLLPRYQPGRGGPAPKTGKVGS